ncbi:MAG: TIGR02281 family clan AA aspartic protease [Hyphomicrobiales bacterium]|nr:TIGR02281 family clan AA aspartic protease [Hyphomicrobiales bacterium]MBV8826784.1 TIGR02281 family clan AA aspartic protease [Hyphomicrobiales bacterium]MBV9427483.1 TIGR02281 family clan AA aspartic protease [Bradyrhizobiaceae bacterium]
MRSIILFAIAAFVAAALAPRYFDRMSSHAAAPAAADAQAPAAQVAAAPKPYSGGRRTVEIQPNARGHFRVDGIVDGRHLTLLVDTGATLVSLRKSDAALLGYHPTARDYILQMRTANGVIRVAQVKLGMVEVGGVMLRDVDASVSPDEALGENLLGVSFLSRLHRFEYREGRLVLEE